MPPHRLFIAMTAARQHHAEYPGAAPPSARRVKGRRPLEEFNLSLLARRMLHNCSYLRAMAPYFAEKAFYQAVAMAEVVIFLKVLPDALGTQAFGYSCLDDMAIRLTGAYRAGGHPGGSSQQLWQQVA